MLLRAITNSQRMRRERGDDLLDHAVGEIFLLGVAGHFWNGSTAIDGLSGSGSAGPAPALPFPAAGAGISERALRSDAVDPNRASEVLQALLADIYEGAIEPALDLVVHDARDADPARLGDPLQPRGDVDAVAVNVAVLEARDRVGGPGAQPPPVRRLGASSPAARSSARPRTTILALARELGCRPSRSTPPARTSTSPRRPARWSTPAPIPPDPLILPDAAQLQTRIDQMPPQVPVDAPWTAEKAREWDTMLGATSAARERREPRRAQPAAAATSARLRQRRAGHVAAVLPLVRRLPRATSRTPAPSSAPPSTADGAQDSRFVGGSQLIPLRLAGPARRTGWRSSAPVRTGRGRTTGHVVLDTDRGVGPARRVVVAAPPPMVLDIDWYPAAAAAPRAAAAADADWAR